MVISALHRKLVRDLWNAKGQYLAVAAVVMCGVAIHVCMDAAMRNLELTRDAYLRDYRFADLFFHIERAPRGVLQKVRDVPGVDEVRGRILRDVTLDITGNPDPVVGRMVSLPWPHHPMLNDVHIASGRYPGARSWNEVLVNPKFAAANKIDIGDMITVTVDDRKYGLKVTGTALSPEFVYAIRDAASFMPDHRGFGILYVPEPFAETLFGLSQGVNDIVVSLDGMVPEEDVLADVEDVLDAYGVTLKVGRKDHFAYQFLTNEIKQLQDSAGVVPPIFLAVAAAVIFISLTRLVRSQRTQIGVMKAFGYSNAAVAVHYMEFALAAGLMGAVPGLLLGDWLAGAMVQMYTEYFQFPLLIHRYYPEVYGGALLTSVAFCAVAGAAATVRTLKINPAQAMRPPAPTRAGAILLERIGWLWRWIPFQTRIVVRNVFRHKGRSLVTITVVSLSGAMVLMAFAMGDAVDYISKSYVLETQRQDAKVSLFSPRHVSALQDLAVLDGVKRAEPLLEVPVDFRNGWRKKTALIRGVTPGGKMLALVDVKDRTYAVPRRGVLLNLRLAQSLGVKKGDPIAVKVLFPGNDEKALTVADVFEEGIGLTGYMDLDHLAKFMNEPPAFNAALIKVEPGRDDAVKSQLKDVGAVSSVILSQRMLESFEEALGSTMGLMTVIYVLFAGVLSFAIIFNSASVAMAERGRELASLRVLGFTLGEVAYILFGEFFLVVALGVVPGLLMGHHLTRATLTLYGTDTVRIPFIVNSSSYAITAALVLSFAVFAALASYRRLKRLDMVEALKARE